MRAHAITLNCHVARMRHTATARCEDHIHQPLAAQPRTRTMMVVAAMTHHIAPLAERASKDKAIFLRADRAVPYGEMMDVLELLRAGGYTKLKLVTLEGVPDPGAVPQPAQPKP